MGNAGRTGGGHWVSGFRCFDEYHGSLHRQQRRLPDDLIRWNESRKLLHNRLDELEKQVEQSEKESHDIDRKRTKLEAQLKTVIAPREAEAIFIKDGNLILQLADDGVGLSPDYEEAAGIGMKTMRYRAGLIGSTLTFGQVEGGGTLLSC